ncbi:MAG: EamA family transporter [Actinomycetota bacterium]|nr:EamA family transporter [Actinomycetota bacterium]
MTTTGSRVAYRLHSPGLVLGGAALFGTIGTAQALGPDIPAGQLAAARLALAAVLLVLAAVATGFSAMLGPAIGHFPTWWAGLSQIGFNLCFFGAVQQAGVAVGTLVAIGATPILTGLVTRRVSRSWMVATGVALAGLVLLVRAQMVSESAPSGVGIMLAIGAAASYATYIIAGNAAAAHQLETQPYLAVAFSIAALGSVPFLFTGDMTWVGTVDGALLVGYLAVFTTVVAYSLFNRGLRDVRPSTASTLGLVEPVVAALLAYLLLGERLSTLGVVGAALILLGLLMIVRSTSGPGPEASP